MDVDNVNGADGEKGEDAEHACRRGRSNGIKTRRKPWPVTTEGAARA